MPQPLSPAASASRSGEVPQRGEFKKRSPKGFVQRVGWGFALNYLKILVKKERRTCRKGTAYLPEFPPGFFVGDDGVCVG
jgi:hypothetical protein